MRYKRPWKHLKLPEKDPYELYMTKKRECIHYILNRLLEEFHIKKDTLIADLEQKFPDVGHKTIWRMYYLEIVVLHDFANWIIGRRDYHWVLNKDSPWLKAPYENQYYFEDVAKEIEARREAGKRYLSKLETTDPQKDSNQQTL